MRVDQVIKVVFTVRRTGTTAEAVRNWMVTTLEPHLRTAAEERLGADLSGLTLDFKHQAVFQRANVYQVYPRLVIGGETELTRVQLRTVWREVRDRLVERLTTQAEALGATILAIYTKEYNE